MIRFPLFGDSDKAESREPSAVPAADQAAGKPVSATHPLDALTGGVFSAPTSGDRAARVRAWMATDPDPADMQQVYKELSARDKGAAKALREKLDEIKRSKGQEQLGVEWAAKAEALLDARRLNIADAMAWQRDAAKAGAPLSKEPLASLKQRLAERVKGIEDLQTRTQIQREAAVLLAQRVEVLSTKSWQDADAAQAALQADVAHWQTQVQELQQDASWSSVDPRFATQLDSSTQQLQLVVQAFDEALAQTRAAVADAAQPLPAVPVWADELRALRGESVEPTAETLSAEDQAAAAEKTAAQAKRREEAQAAVLAAIARLEQELKGGHSKAGVTAAQTLRQALKEHRKLLGAEVEGKAHAALASAGELEGWQRWRADQIRQELVQKAEALIERASPLHRKRPRKVRLPPLWPRPILLPQCRHRLRRARLLLRRRWLNPCPTRQQRLRVRQSPLPRNLLLRRSLLQVPALQSQPKPPPQGPHNHLWRRPATLPQWHRLPLRRKARRSRLRAPCP